MERKKKNHGTEEGELYETVKAPEGKQDRSTGEIQKEETAREKGEEKAGKEGDTQDGNQKPEFTLKQIAVTGFSLVVLFLILFFFSGIYGARYPAPELSREISETPKESDEAAETEIRTVLLTGRDDETEGLASESAANLTEAETPEAGELPDEWQDTIFGEEKPSLLSSIRVSGLSSAVKEKTGYREADFLNTLSSFLQESHLGGITDVIFEEEVLCSAPDSYAFRADLAGREDKVLTVILYPDYPGKYLLILQDKQEVTVEVKTQPASESDVLQQILPQETGRKGTEKEPAQIYDATTLSVNAIPATLLNYLDNRYELQYTLYDYLYRQGRSDVIWAEVTGYEIDADSKTAKISFRLSDSGSLTCLYNKTDNSYSYL